MKSEKKLHIEIKTIFYWWKTWIKTEEKIKAKIAPMHWKEIRMNKTICTGRSSVEKLWVVMPFSESSMKTMKFATKISTHISSDRYQSVGK